VSRLQVVCGNCGMWLIVKPGVSFSLLVEQSHQPLMGLIKSLHPSSDTSLRTANEIHGHADLECSLYQRLSSFELDC